MGAEVQEIEEPSSEVEDPNTDDDESTLRKHSSDTFADAEFHLMARYIARGPSWFDNTDSLERLRPFQVKHPHRTLSTWHHFYAVHERDIRCLIERYKAQYSYEEEDLVLSYPAELDIEEEVLLCRCAG
ncbi:hypothetical protein CERSUDRAFT_79747 [Gelatoporia subvermispora B]|uniref:Uncharacterized protein n=1 Tax=Ceriporiopsis subvermispora (strain B) TaxID=914234 RepID=M2RUK5_CERS8|nr:hypothetical protein CERSUDRAFT_79747 [Gelatoporia subvermispora B]